MCIGEMKGLQKHLGRYQDACYQIIDLGSRGRELVAAGRVGTEELLTIGGLVEDLDRRRHQLRTQFPRRFAAFDTDANHKAYERLVAKP